VAIRRCDNFPATTIIKRFLLFFSLVTFRGVANLRVCINRLKIHLLTPASGGGVGGGGGRMRGASTKWAEIDTAEETEAARVTGDQKGKYDQTSMYLFLSKFEPKARI
jgi:hypothetical protein